MSNVTSCGEWEQLLIRVGHHLWADRRKLFNMRDMVGVRVMDAALDSVWGAKRLYRASMHDRRRDAASVRMWERRGRT